MILEKELSKYVISGKTEEKLQKPEGLCDNAWKSMMEYAMTLAHGGENFYDGWMKDKKSAMVACNDGFRPVIFLLEATDENAEVFEN